MFQGMQIKEEAWKTDSGTTMAGLITFLSNLSANEKNNVVITVSSTNFTNYRLRRLSDNEYAFFSMGSLSITSGLLVTSSSKLYRRVYTVSGTTIAQNEETISAWSAVYPAL